MQANDLKSRSEGGVVCRMAYRFLEGLTTADVAFEATGCSLAELFVSASEATLHTMVESPDEVENVVRRPIRVSDRELDLVLFGLLEELLYYKDAEGLLLRLRNLHLELRESVWVATADGEGQELDPERHEQRADVKAVTLHRLKVEPTPTGWRCCVILDV